MSLLWKPTCLQPLLVYSLYFLFLAPLFGVSTNFSSRDDVMARRPHATRMPLPVILWKSDVSPTSFTISMHTLILIILIIAFTLAWLARETTWFIHSS